MNETTFEGARIGDQVWTKKDGWGSIVKIDDNEGYPITVRFGDQRDSFTKKGFAFESDSHQSLFWGEIKIPTRPKRKIIRKVKYWGNIFDITYAPTLYLSKEAALECGDVFNIVNGIKLTGEYEGEE